jgi:DNA-3-methyladenine glycosylase II
VPQAIVLEPSGPFDLRQAIGFGFGPREAGGGELLRLAFAADGDGAPAGVVLGQPDPGGTVSGAIHGDADPEVVTAQVARILSLDVDAEPWEDLGDRDEVLGGLQERFAGLRPVLFHSPYEAACWAVLSARWGRAQATRARDAIAAAHGHTFKLAGEVLTAWPAPARLLAALDEGRVIGVPGEKLRRLHGIAKAALAGQLDAARLQALGPEAAEDAVGELRGFGPFYRSLVVVRSVGFTDALAAEETRSRRAAAQLHGLGALDADAFAALAERWRPFRTWATVLLRVAAEHDGLT